MGSVFLPINQNKPTHLLLPYQKMDNFAVGILGGLILLGVAGSSKSTPPPYSFNLTTGALAASTITATGSTKCESSLIVAGGTITDTLGVTGAATIAKGLTVTGGTSTDTITVTAGGSVAKGLTVTGGSTTDTLTFAPSATAPTTKIVATTPSTSRTYTIPDMLANGNFLFDVGSPNILTFPGWKIQQVVIPATVVGHNVIYTVPSGLIALIYNITIGNTTGSTSGQIYSEVNIGGTYYQTIVGGTVGGNSRGNAIPAPFFLNAGNSFSINSATASLLVTATVFTFSSSVPVTSNWVAVSTASQTLTLFSSTANTIAIGINGSVSATLSSGLSSVANSQILPNVTSCPILHVINPGSTPANLTFIFTPFGGSAITLPVVVAGDSNVLNIGLGFPLNSGDVLTVTSDTTVSPPIFVQMNTYDIA